MKKLTLIISFIISNFIFSKGTWPMGDIGGSVSQICDQGGVESLRKNANQFKNYNANSTGTLAGLSFRFESAKANYFDGVCSIRKTNSVNENQLNKISDLCGGFNKYKSEYKQTLESSDFSKMEKDPFYQGIWKQTVTNHQGKMEINKNLEDQSKYPRFFTSSQYSSACSAFNNRDPKKIRSFYSQISGQDGSQLQMNIGNESDNQQLMTCAHNALPLEKPKSGSSVKMWPMPNCMGCSKIISSGNPPVLQYDKSSHCQSNCTRDGAVKSKQGGQPTTHREFVVNSGSIDCSRVCPGRKGSQGCVKACPGYDVTSGKIANTGKALAANEGQKQKQVPGNYYHSNLATVFYANPSDACMTAPCRKLLKDLSGEPVMNSGQKPIYVGAEQANKNRQITMKSIQDKPLSPAEQQACSMINNAKQRLSQPKKRVRR